MLPSWEVRAPAVEVPLPGWPAGLGASVRGAVVAHLLQPGDEAMKLQKDHTMSECRRDDHPDRPHFHSGPGGRYADDVYPHWDPVYADGLVYAKPPLPLAIHPDMNPDEGWTS